MGQTGAIPANYVELINDEFDPLKQPSVSSNGYQNNTVNNSDIQTNNQSQQYMNSTSINNWSTSESILPLFDQLSVNYLLF